MYKLFIASVDAMQAVCVLRYVNFGQFTCLQTNTTLCVHFIARFLDP